MLNIPPGVNSLAEIKAWQASSDYVLQKAAELLALAYVGYTKQGRGALLVGYAEGDNIGVPLLYIPAADLRNLRDPLGASAVRSLRKQADAYDPERQACLCIIVYGDLNRVLVIQTPDGSTCKDIFAANAAQYLAQMESRTEWHKKWGAA